MRTHVRLAKNALANLARGASSTVVTIFLPAVLVRHMSQADYSVWVLVLQVAAYSIYLESGLQTAVGRYLAISIEQKDPDRGDSVYSTALVGLSIVAAIACAIITVIALCAGGLFPSVPAAALPHLQLALLIAGTSVALGLPSFAWIGVFVGLQRNEFIALVTGGAKLLSAAGLVVAVLYGYSVVVMAMVVAVINLSSYLLLFLLVRRLSPVRFRLHLVRRATARELFGYCFGLMVWSLSMLMVNGLDLTLVGRFQFSALAPYAIATALVNTIQGMQLAVFGAAMPHAAVLHARKDTAGLGRLLVSYTRLGVLLLLLAGMPLLIYAAPLLRAWVGPHYASQGRMLLNVLVVANIIRLVATPYTVVLVASGQQRLVTLSPILEGLTNLGASIVLGLKYGAAGVAAGTLIGAIVGLLGHIFYNMPRTRHEILLSIRNFIVSGICLPTAVCSLLVALAVRSWRGAMPGTLIFSSALAVTLALAVALFMRGKSEIRQESVS